MNALKRQLYVSALALLVGLLGSLALAAHNGNNKADFSGEASGKAVVNYREGTGTFNGSITVRGLEPGGSYSFSVDLNGDNETTICDGQANNGGVFRCSAQGLSLPGFNTAILSGEGLRETSTFSRTGNCRDPEQGGSQCDAPGHNNP